MNSINFEFDGRDKRPIHLKDEKRLVILEEGLDHLSSRYPWLIEVIGTASVRGRRVFKFPHGGNVVAYMEPTPGAPFHDHVHGEWEVRYFMIPGNYQEYQVLSGELEELPSRAVLTSTIRPGLPAGRSFEQALERAREMGVDNPDYGIGDAEE
jgi:hypothetical protein